jgi:hypothetical protein
MLARGFSGHTQLLSSARIGLRDLLFLVAGLALILALRMSLGGLWNP